MLDGREGHFLLFCLWLFAGWLAGWLAGWCVLLLLYWGCLLAVRVALKAQSKRSIKRRTFEHLENAAHRPLLATREATREETPIQRYKPAPLSPVPSAWPGQYHRKFGVA